MLIRLFLSFEIPVYRALTILLNFLLFRIVAIQLGANGVASVYASLSLLAFWVLGDYGMHNLILREAAKAQLASYYHSNFRLLQKRLLHSTMFCFVAAFLVTSYLSADNELPLDFTAMIIGSVLSFIAANAIAYEKILFGSGGYKVVLRTQVFSSIVAVIVAYELNFLGLSTPEYMFYLVLLSPAISALLCATIVKMKVMREPIRLGLTVGSSSIYNGSHNKLFFGLAVISMIGNGFDVYIINKYYGAEMTAAIVLSQKIINPFHTLYQSWVLQFWPKWEQELSREGAGLFSLASRIKKIAFIGLVWMSVALFGSLIFLECYAKSIFNLEVSEILIPLSFGLYRLSTAYTEPKTIVLQTEGYLKTYFIICAILNFTLIFTKISISFSGFDLYYFYISAAIIQLIAINGFVIEIIHKKAAFK